MQKPRSFLGRHCHCYHWRLFQAGCGHFLRVYPLHCRGLCAGSRHVGSDGQTSQCFSSPHLGLCPTFLLSSTLFLPLMVPTWWPQTAFQWSEPPQTCLTILPGFRSNIQTLPVPQKPVFGTTGLNFLGLPKNWSQSDKVNLPMGG